MLQAIPTMDKHGLPGKLVFFGEPAEKVCGSKPVHAAPGYYDDLDAAIALHPGFSRAQANTVIWDTHCGSYWIRRGAKWLAPLLPKDFRAPIHYRWPEYVSTPRGAE